MNSQMEIYIYLKESAGASVPVEVGRACHSHGCVYQFRRSPNSILGGFMRHQRMCIINLKTQFPVPLPSSENGIGTESSKLLIMGSCFWWTAPIYEPTRSHLVRRKDTLITQEIAKILGALCQELGMEISIYVSCYYAVWRSTWDLLGYETCSNHLSPVWLWANSLTSVCFNLFYKVRTLVPNSQGFCKSLNT